MTAFVAGLLMCGASCMAQDTISARTTLDPDMMVAEHVEWVQTKFPDAEFDVTQHRYVMDEVRPVQVGRDMLDTFYGLLECGKREFPQHNHMIGEISFHQIKFFVYKEGWFLDRSSHDGYQFAGVVLAGRYVGIEVGFVEDGKVITHELVHVLYPTFNHQGAFREIHAKCWRDVWYRDVDE